MSKPCLSYVSNMGPETSNGILDQALETQLVVPISTWFSHISMVHSYYKDKPHLQPGFAGLPRAPHDDQDIQTKWFSEVWPDWIWDGFEGSQFFECSALAIYKRFHRVPKKHPQIKRWKPIIKVPSPQLYFWAPNKGDWKDLLQRDSHGTPFSHGKKRNQTI